LTAGHRSGQEEQPPSERLLAAARHLFGERSYQRTTVADICAGAGLATGSFYACFESKSDILAAIIRQTGTDVRAAQAAALRDAPDNWRARERASFRAHLDLISRRPWIYRIVREAEFFLPALFRDYHESLIRGYSRGVRLAQRAGEVDARYDPELIACVYAGLTHVIGMRWAEWTEGGRVPDDIVEDLMAFLGRALPPRGGS
jgi:AcrR family transcriptional regulator